MKTVCLPLLGVRTPARAQARLFLLNTKGVEFACSWLPCRRFSFLFCFFYASGEEKRRAPLLCSQLSAADRISFRLSAALAARFFVLCQFTFKGIVYPKLNLHPFCTHPDVEGGSGGIFFESP